MWEICGQQGASLFVSIWTSQAHQTDVFSARESAHTCSHLEHSFPKLKDMCDHFSFDSFLVGLLHTQKSRANEGFFSLQPAEAQSYKLLSAGCKALRGPSKLQEMYGASFQLACSMLAWRPSQHCGGTRVPSPPSETRLSVLAGHHRHSRPARVSQPFTQWLRIPEMTRHINTSLVLAYWNTFRSWVISRRAH